MNKSLLRYELAFYFISSHAQFETSEEYAPVSAQLICAEVFDNATRLAFGGLSDDASSVSESDRESNSPLFAPVTVLPPERPQTPEERRSSATSIQRRHSMQSAASMEAAERTSVSSLTPVMSSKQLAQDLSEAHRTRMSARTRSGQASPAPPPSVAQLRGLLPPELPDSSEPDAGLAHFDQLINVPAKCATLFFILYSDFVTAAV